MSTASDGCGSFNCMSALNDGILNSYTFHTIAFRPGRGPGRQPGISVAIWRGRQSPCWVIGGLTPSPMHQTNCYTVLKPHIGCQATGLMKHAHIYHHIYTYSQEMVKYELQDVFYTLWDTKDPKTHLIAVSSWSWTPIRTNTRIHTPTHPHTDLKVCWQSCQLMVTPSRTLLSCERVTFSSFISLIARSHHLICVGFTILTVPRCHSSRTAQKHSHPDCETLIGNFCHGKKQIYPNSVCVFNRHIEHSFICWSEEVTASVVALKLKKPNNYNNILFHAFSSHCKINVIIKTCLCWLEINLLSLETKTNHLQCNRRIFT